jgi:hypothetical protein
LFTVNNALQNLPRSFPAVRLRSPSDICSSGCESRQWFLLRLLCLNARNAVELPYCREVANAQGLGLPYEAHENVAARYAKDCLMLICMN